MNQARNVLQMLFALTAAGAPRSAGAVMHGGIHLVSASFSKSSQDGTVSATLPAGVSASASAFVTDRFAAGLSAELDMELGQKSVVFMGGELYTSYFLAGGDPVRIDANLFLFDSDPRLNIYLIAGLAQRTFNFQAFEATSSKVLRRRASDNISEGSFFGPMFGAGVDFPVSRTMSFSLRGKMVQGFGNTFMPSIQVMSVMVGLGVAL